MAGHFLVVNDRDEIIERRNSSPRRGAGKVVGWPDSLRIIPLERMPKPQRNRLQTYESRIVINGDSAQEYFDLVDLPIPQQRKQIIGQGERVVREALGELEDFDVWEMLAELAADELSQQSIAKLRFVRRVKRHARRLVQALNGGNAVDIEAGTANTVNGGWPTLG